MSTEDPTNLSEQCNKKSSFLKVLILVPAYLYMLFQSLLYTFLKSIFWRCKHPLR